MQEDPQLGQIIKKIAELKVKSAISSLLQRSESQQNAEKTIRQNQIFMNFIKNCISQDPELSQSIKIINTFFLDEINIIYPQLSNQERDSVARRHTKDFIKSAIQQQTAEKVKLIDEKKAETEKVKQVKEEKEEDQPQVSFKRKLQVSQFQQSNSRKLIKIEGEVSIQNHVIISDIQGAETTEKPAQPSLPMKFDPVRETEKFGNFHYGDKPQQIIDIFLIDDELYVTITWQYRSNGFLPESSTLSVDFVRTYYPAMLASYYEQFISNYNEENPTEEE